MNDMERFRRMAQPPPWALKAITAGRQKGKTDIKPAWRIEAMTELYGMCGVGWYFEVPRRWTQEGPDGQKFAFVDVNLYIKVEGEWSEAIPGNGGSMLIDKEKGGLYCDDDAFKKATTDAMGNAMRLVGIAHDIYASQWDGSKYLREGYQPTKEELRQEAIDKLSPEEKEKFDKAVARMAATTSVDDLKLLGEALNENGLTKAVHELLRQNYLDRRNELKKQEESSDAN